MGFFEDAWDAAGDAVGAVGDAIGDAVEGAVDAVEDAVDAVDEFAEDAVDALGELAEDALDALGELGEDALDAAGDVFAAFEELAEAAWDGATDLVDGAIDALGNAAEDAWEALSEAAEDAWNAIEEAGADAWEAISDAADALWEELTEELESAWEAAAGSAEALFDTAANLYERALAVIEKTVMWLGDLVEDAIRAIAMLGACLAGQIVHDLAEAGNVVANILKSPQTLPQAFRDDVRPLFPAVALEDVRFIQNASLTANMFGDGTSAMTFMRPEVLGVTLGYMIYVADGWDPAVPADRALMVHELVHVDQYRRFRFEDAFACAYGIGFASAGFSYEDNPLEAEAFAVQHAFAALP
jgi:vacuolar-type H+-ATPase subunit H